jgi:Leucine-rich repeat (LRR) protein
MPNLIVLDVRNNALRMIPSEISQLGKLQCLLLTNNKLESLPVQLVDMESLEVVHIWNNPLSCIPKPHNLYQFHVMRVQDTTLFTHLRRYAK